MFAAMKQRFASGPAQRARVAPGNDTSTAATEVQARDPSNWYMQQASEFEKSKVDAAREQAKRADRRSVLFGGIALVAVFGIGALGVLKRPNPPAVLRVDNATGKVDVLPTAANGHVTFGEKSDRADLRRYVEWRESYDWETIQDVHDAVMLMSSEHEKDIYDNFIRGANGPLKVLKDQARVIAKVGVITFVGTTAQVFLARQLIPLNPGVARPEPTYWVATISYRHDDIPEKVDAQDVDPTGWRATSYTVTRDWTRAPALDPVASPAAAASAVSPTGGSAR
jgi:type IV secretion system protein VirB8